MLSFLSLLWDRDVLGRFQPHGKCSELCVRAFGSSIAHFYRIGSCCSDVCFCVLGVYDCVFVYLYFSFAVRELFLCSGCVWKKESHVY